MTDPGASRDLRASISETADQVLEALSIARNCTKQDLVRRVVDQWAAQQIHESTLVERMTRRDGKKGSATE